MPALNGKDRAAARMLVAAVVTLLALFVPPEGMTSAAAGGAGPRVGSTDPVRLSGARPLATRQARSQTAPVLAFGSIPPAVLPSAGLVAATLIRLGLAATVVDHGPRRQPGRLPGSRAPPAAAR